MPWTSIDPATFEPVDDLSRLLAVAEFRYQNRKDGDQEFAWLMSDIEEYNRGRGDTSVSLLESVRRQEMAEREEKRAERKKQRGDGDSLVMGDHPPVDTGEDEESAGDERPDLLLRESARIVADMVELESDGQQLAQEFAMLAKANKGGPIN